MEPHIERFYRLEREKTNIDRFLNCDSIKEFYSKNGMMQHYNNFIEEIKGGDFSILFLYLNYLNCTSNDLTFFEIDLKNKFEDFDKIKEHKIEGFEVTRIFMRDSDFFYELLYERDKKGFVKTPVPSPYENLGEKNAR